MSYKDVFLVVNLKMKNLKIILIPIIIVIVNCDIFDNPVDPMSKNYVESTITFDANGADEGSVPESITAGLNTEVTIPSVGNLVRDTYIFQGWNTKSDGSGISYNPGDTLTIGSEDITLYAIWAGAYRVIYNANTADSGTVPSSSSYVVSGSSIVIEGNTGNLVKDNQVFKGWNTVSDGTGTHYNTGDTLTIGSDNILLYAHWGLEIGSISNSGGYIFYDKGFYTDGWRYLEAAPEDVSGTKIWGSLYHYAEAGGTAIGTGAQNTLNIIAVDSSTTNAANACANYSFTVDETTYDDWFLPSQDELDLMYDNLKVNGLGGFQSSNYWSSSEHTKFDYAAKGQSFDDGSQYYYNKNNYDYVRPIRAF